MKKSNIKLKYLLITLLAVFIISIIILISTSPKIEYINDNNKITYKHDEEYVDSYEYIFIAQVVKKEKTKKYDGTGTDIPYTFYKINQVEFLKGDVISLDSDICFYGGNKSLKRIELLSNNDELIEIREYYLFFSNIKNNILNDRIDKDDFIISDNNQKILLKDYDSSVKSEKQSNDIKFIIERYKNIIDQNLDNEILEVPKVEEGKMISSYFECAAIIRINNFSPFSINGNGEKSHIPSVSYNIEIIECIKGNNLSSNKLYCYGTNFWNIDFNNYVDILNENDIYLVFANCCQDNKDNTRIGIGDFIVMDNYQLVKLDGYDLNKSYLKQAEEIKNVISRYIDI